MTDSDSDLEFESADENQDLSDLDIDEILNDDKKETNKRIINSHDDILKRSSEKDTVNESLIDRIQSVDLNRDEVEFDSNEHELETQVDTKLIVKESETQVDTQLIVKEPETKIEKSGWDESEIEEPIIETVKSGWDESDVEIEEPKNNPEIKTVVEKSGWDDTEFEDIETDRNKEITKPKEKVESQIEPVVKQESKGWGWSSFLSTAVNLTSQIGEGLNTVLTTVEAGIGAPDPHELATKISKAKEEEVQQDTKNDDWSFNDSNDWFTLQKLQTIAPTGVNIVNSGLDVLETVGKKTIGLINDKDPNLQQTRSILNKVPVSSKQPSLSEVLREAKSRESDQEVELTKKSNQVQIKEKNFDTFFEEFNGKLHFEALEILSREMSVKVEMRNKHKPNGFSELETIFDANNLDDESDSDYLDELDETILKKCPIINLDKSFNPKNFKQVFESYSKVVNFSFDKFLDLFDSFKFDDLKETRSCTIELYALFSARIIEFYHKSVQSMLRETTILKDTEVIESAQEYLKITRLFTSTVTVIADHICKKCKDLKTSQSKELNQLITDIYLEASNCSTIIGDGFVHLLPIYKNQLASV